MLPNMLRQGPLLLGGHRVLLIAGCFPCDNACHRQMSGHGCGKPLDVKRVLLTLPSTTDRVLTRCFKARIS